MDAYLQNLRSLRVQMNEYEDKAAILTAERHKHEAAIRAMEKDLQSVNAESRRLDEEMADISRQAGVISMSLLRDHKEMAKLDRDSEALAQAYEILSKDVAAAEEASKAKTAYYDQCTTEMLAQFERFKSTTEPQDAVVA